MDANVVNPQKGLRTALASADAPVTRMQGVDFFEITISNLYEKDYGDFMRKCMLYIDRLRIDVGAQPQAQAIIEKMKMYTAYASDFDIENTRLHLMRDADEIKKLVR